MKCVWCLSINKIQCMRNVLAVGKKWGVVKQVQTNQKFYNIYPPFKHSFISITLPILRSWIDEKFHSIQGALLLESSWSVQYDTIFVRLLDERIFSLPLSLSFIHIPISDQFFGLSADRTCLFLCVPSFQSLRWKSEQLTNINRLPKTNIILLFQI